MRLATSSASFLEVLIAERKGARVGQVEIGARLGKTQTWVSTYEPGVGRLDFVEFYAVAVPPEAFFAKVVRRVSKRVEI